MLEKRQRECGHNIYTPSINQPYKVCISTQTPSADAATTPKPNS